MRWLALICVVGCNYREPSLEITSPGDGDTVPLTGDIVVTAIAYDTQKALSLEVDATGTPINYTDTTWDIDCGGCEFTVTLPVGTLSPGSTRIHVDLIYDLSTVADDYVDVTFVAP